MKHQPGVESGIRFFYAGQGCRAVCKKERHVRQQSDGTIRHALRRYQPIPEYHFFESVAGLRSAAFPVVFYDNALR